MKTDGIPPNLGCFSKHVWDHITSRARNIANYVTRLPLLPQGSSSPFPTWLIQGVQAGRMRAANTHCVRGGGRNIGSQHTIVGNWVGDHKTYLSLILLIENKHQSQHCLQENYIGEPVCVDWNYDGLERV